MRQLVKERNYIKKKKKTTTDSNSKGEKKLHIKGKENYRLLTTWLSCDQLSHVLG